MATKYILGALAVVFLLLAIIRLARGGGVTHPQTRSWLILGILFAIVSGYLFSQE